MRLHQCVSRILGTGSLSFEDFCTLAARFMTEEEEDSEAIKTELREAFRLYDKEGSARKNEKKTTRRFATWCPVAAFNCHTRRMIPNPFSFFVPQETVT